MKSRAISDSDKYEVRRLALQALVDRFGRGGKAHVAREIGKPADYVSRMLYPPGKEGRKRIGEDSVEILDAKFPGWLSGSTAAAENVTDGPDIRGEVPLIGLVQAGNWREVIDNLHPGDGERIPTTYRARAHTYAVRVEGDSMEPRFPEDAILIVEPDESPEPGKFVIVRQGGAKATFKQLVQDGGRYYLKPINPRYDIMELQADAVICGVVKRLEMDI